MNRHLVLPEGDMICLAKKSQHIFSLLLRKDKKIKNKNKNKKLTTKLFGLVYTRVSEKNPTTDQSLT